MVVEECGEDGIRNNKVMGSTIEVINKLYPMYLLIVNPHFV